MGASDASAHTPVLLGHVLALLAETRLERLIDGTLGAGGHSLSILTQHPDCSLLGLDRDPRALAISADRLGPFAGRTMLVQSRFSAMAECTAKAGWDRVDAILLDIGVSSMQLDQADYGMSFQAEAPLDMRMGTEGETAAELISRLGESELADIIYQYGEERLSRRIASRIKTQASTGDMATTSDLARACISAYPKGHHRIHPATRTFQALRIAVNDELGELTRALESVPTLLRDGGRLLVICFHSIEDRIVKNQFRDWQAQGLGRILTKKPLTADEGEAHRNPRARSAKLRAFVWGAGEVPKKRKWRGTGD